MPDETTTIHGLLKALRVAARRPSPHAVLLARAAAVIDDLAKRLSPRLDQNGVVEIESMIRAVDGEPGVTFTFNGAMAQLDADAARRIGLHFIEAATAAETESALYKVCRTIDLDERAIALLLTNMRGELQRRIRPDAPE